MSAEVGSATWDGESDPVVSVPVPAGEATAMPEGVDGALADFIDALWTGRVPMGEVHDNLMSFAMVEAAVAAAIGQRRVYVADLIAAARRPL